MRVPSTEMLSFLLWFWVAAAPKSGFWGSGTFVLCQQLWHSGPEPLLWVLCHCRARTDGSAGPRLTPCLHTITKDRHAPPALGPGSAGRGVGATLRAPARLLCLLKTSGRCQGPGKQLLQMQEPQ